MAFRTKQVADFLDIRSSQVQKLLSSGRLRGHKHIDGKHWLVEKEDLAYFIVTEDYYKKKFAKIIASDSSHRNDFYILLREVNKLIS